MKTASISKVSGVQKTFAAAIAQTESNRIAVKGAQMIEAPAHRIEVQNVGKTTQNDLLIVLKRDKANQDNGRDDSDRGDKDDNKDNSNGKKCEIDLTTGVANWQINGSPAPVIHRTCIGQKALKTQT